MRSVAMSRPLCSVERTVSLVGDRWSFLVLREALFYGETRFSGFITVLGIASNVLTDRLDRLVEAGLLERRSYQHEGERARFSYHPTDAGRDFTVVLAALQQWGDAHVTPDRGPSVLRQSRESGEPVDVSFVAADGTIIRTDDVEFRLAPQYESGSRE